MAVNIPLAISIDSRDATLAADGRLLNCYAEQSATGWSIYKRPGVDNYATYLGPGQGQYVWRGDLYTIFNDVMNNNDTAAQYTLSIYEAQGQQYQFSQTAGQDGTAIGDGTAWTQATASAAWTDRNLSATCVFNGRMWIAGGNETGTIKNDVYYSTDGITWTQATAAAAWSARCRHRMLVYNNRMWILGGSPNAAGGTALNDVWYSTDGITWTEATASAGWADRSELSALTYNNRMWVMAGQLANTATLYNDVWYSTDGANWTQATAAAAFPAGYGYSEAVFLNRMWMMAGTSLSENYGDNVWYSTDGITWTQATAAAGWAGRFNAVGLSYNNRLWIISGQINGAVEDDVWSSADGVTWSQATATAGFSARQAATGVVFNNLMWIMSGASNAGTTNNEVWYSTANSTTTSVGPTPYLMIKNNRLAWYLSGTTLTQISDVDYPAETVPGCLYLNGTFYVMDRAGQIHGSDLEDPSAWNSLNFITSEAEPDIGIAIAKILNYVVALGEWSMEAFQDVANSTGSPLARIDGAYRQYGCASAGSVAYIENGLVFMSQSKLRGREVVRMLGLEVERISTPSVEKVMLADDLSTVHAFCFKAGGREFYVLTLVDSAVTLVCDLANKIWYQWSSLIAGTAQSVTTLTSSGTTATATKAAHGYSDGQVVLIAGANQAGYNGTFVIRVVSSSVFTYTVASGLVTPATGTITATGYTDSYFRYINYVNNNGVDVVQHISDGLLYQIGTGYTNDNDVRINSRARTSTFNGRTLDNKSFPYLRLDADNISATAYVRWTDDDYSTYNLFRPISLAGNRKEIRNLTRSRRRAFEVMHADDSTFIAYELELGVLPWRI